MRGSNGTRPSVRVAIPLDDLRPEAALDEAVILVRHLGAAVKGIGRRDDRRAIVLQVPVRQTVRV